MNVTILGAGAWGTALGIPLSKNGHTLTLWAYDPEHLRAIERDRRNVQSLPEIELPAGWRFEPDLAEAVREAEAVLLAVPSSAFRATAVHLAGFGGLAVSATKGVEYDTGLTMSAILRECAPRAAVAALSGPTFALEVARGIPTAAVAAAQTTGDAARAQELFHRSSFRVYTSTDLLGVELGGALKNVMAIAAGVGDGLGFGDNTKAALLTRGLAEMRRLGVASGANAETFAGLSGLGDLCATCFSKLSRNRRFGERLGRGESLEEVLRTSTAVAEGYPTARSAHRLAQRLGVPTPIVDEVCAMLYEGKDPARAVQDLTARSSKAED